MGRVLASTVILTDEKTGAPLVFLEGDLPKKKYADQIVNPKAWRVDESDDSDDADDADDDDTIGGDADDQGDDTGDAGDDAGDGDAGDGELPVPKGNANKAAWKAYAESKGVELGDDAKVADYKAAVAGL